MAGKSESEFFEDKPSCSEFLDDLLRGEMMNELRDLPELQISIYGIYEKTCG